MIAIEVTYFGILSEKRGLTHENIFTAVADASGLFAQVFGVDNAALRGVVRAVVNDEIVSWDCVLRDGDQVAFLPPMSGG